MKRKINVWEYADTICDQIDKGILVTARGGDQVNPMTIGWGTLGVQWGKPIFIVFVRESRYTKKLLDENPEFTINVPVNGCDKNILSFCGTRSGRDVDKVEALGLHLEAPETISVPGIRELPLTLECKVIYQQDQLPEAINEENTLRYYPKDANGKGDYHTAYYGQITAAYLIED